MASFGPVPGQRPPASLLGSLQLPVLALGLRALPLPPMSDHITLSVTLFFQNNIGRTVKRKGWSIWIALMISLWKVRMKGGLMQEAKTVCHPKKKKSWKRINSKRNIVKSKKKKKKEEREREREREWEWISYSSIIEHHCKIIELFESRSTKHNDYIIAWKESVRNTWISLAQT